MPLVGLLMSVLAAGCGSAGGDTRRAVEPVGPPAVSDPVEPCPGRLPPDRGEATAGEPPSLPGPVDRGWVCTYGGPDAPDTWKRTGALVELDAATLAQVRDDLDALEPAAVAERLCTADLGPRYLVVLASSDQLTRVSVDDYGCRDVRLVGEPGVLEGPPGLVMVLREAVGPDQR